MQDASQLATAHYPETLDRIFIIGAPAFFPTVWGWIKRWFDPITVSKIFILSAADMKPTLEKYIDIENIPVKYGGKLEYEWGMMPLLEPAIAETLTWKEDGPLLKGCRTIPTGPIKWRGTGRGDRLGADVTHAAGGLEMVAAGAEDGTKRDKVLASIQSSFSDMHGISRQNTQVNWGLERVQSTTGTATQPKEEGDLYYGADLASPDASGTATPAPAEATAGAMASTVVPIPGNSNDNTPARPMDDGSNDLPPSDTQPREGTSATKLEQQEVRHITPSLHPQRERKLTNEEHQGNPRSGHKRARHTEGNPLRRRRQGADLRARNRRSSAKGHHRQPAPRRGTARTGRARAGAERGECGCWRCGGGCE